MTVFANEKHAINNNAKKDGKSGDVNQSLDSKIKLHLPDYWIEYTFPLLSLLSYIQSHVAIEKELYIEIVRSQMTDSEKRYLFAYLVANKHEPELEVLVSSKVLQKRLEWTVNWLKDDQGQYHQDVQATINEIEKA